MIEGIDKTIEKLRSACCEGSIAWVISDGRIFHNSTAINNWLRIVGIPVYGIDTTLQSLTDNKFLMTSLAHQHGIKVPKSYLYRGRRQIFQVDGFDQGQGFFVKPNCLGSQIGIGYSSHVTDLCKAESLCHKIQAKYGAESIVQSYIDGNDIRVSCIQKNESIFGIQCSEVSVIDESGSQSHFSTNKKISGRVWNYKNVSSSKPISQSALSSVNILFQLGLIKDYCAIDMRGDESSGYYFLENNVKPFVSEKDFLPLALQEDYESAGAMFFASIAKCIKSQVV